MNCWAAEIKTRMGNMSPEFHTAGIVWIELCNSHTIDNEPAKHSTVMAGLARTRHSTEVRFEREDKTSLTKSNSLLTVNRCVANVNNRIKNTNYEL